MPNPRKTNLRTQPGINPNALANKLKGESNSLDDELETGQPAAALILPPRHAHVPEIGLDNNLFFEGFVFIFGAMVLMLQYINLYKTVWWLPHSHSNYALNFYLIDPYLSTLLVLIMARRVTFVFLNEFYSGRGTWSCCHYMVKAIKLLMILALGEMLCYCIYQVILKYSLLYSLFLCYPLATYAVLFGFQIQPLFGKSMSVSVPEKGSPRHRQRDNICRELPYHTCSMTPEVVRDEVEMLKTDFNCRIKQVLFNSMACAYYMAFVPLCFAQHCVELSMGFTESFSENTLYYDTWWVGQHVCLVWISAFVMFMVYYLPAQYLDTLHQSALHLGKWLKVEGRNAHVPYNAWSELQVWQRGALVKHVKGLFKAEGVNNSAEPGNSMHSRFHFMFHKPCRLTNWLLTITWCLVLYQFWLLINSTEWSHILSLAFMLFCNYYVLFKLMRDRFVMGKAYKDEESTNGGTL